MLKFSSFCLFNFSLFRKLGLTIDIRKPQEKKVDRDWRLFWRVWSLFSFSEIIWEFFFTDEDKQPCNSRTRLSPSSASILSATNCSLISCSCLSACWHCLNEENLNQGKEFTILCWSIVLAFSTLSFSIFLEKVIFRFSIISPLFVRSWSLCLISASVFNL